MHGVLTCDGYVGFTLKEGMKVSELQELSELGPVGLISLESID